jgi:hypothetical protein
MPGFPIRTPWDHSLVDSSPRPIAASHVLHRLLVPRHPPFALDNLTTKMLASTVQFSTNDQPTTRSASHQQPHTGIRYARPGHAWRRRNPHAPLTAPKKQPTVVLSGPNRVLSASTQPHQENRSHHRSSCTRHPGRCRGKTGQCLRHLSTPTRHSRAAGSIPPFDGWCSLERR